MTGYRSTYKRRTLLKGALLGTTVAATTVEGSNEQKQRKWDREVDVVVVGSGTGLVGALVAAKTGLKVLVVEKSASPGGSTVVSGGVFWIPDNRVMRREGIKDSREDSIRYLQRLAQGQASESIIDAFVDHGPDMVDFLEANTSLKFRVSRLMGEVSDYHPEWPGSNVKGRSLESVQEHVGVSGGLLITGILQAVIQAGGELLTEAPAKRLLVTESEDGVKTVEGIVIEHEGRSQNILVRHGILIASGGFERNQEMKQHFLRGPSPYTLGAETNSGDGIKMGMAIGADLRNMNEVWGMTVYRGDAEANGAGRAGISLNAQIEKRYAHCIKVNRYGERFCNEAADYDSTWRSYHTWENYGATGFRNLPAFLIFDSNYRDKHPLAGKAKNESLPEWVIKADSINELAEKLGIDEAGLKETIERFNKFAENGIDEDFGRGKSLYDTNGSKNPSITLGALTKPPFYGAEICPADLGTCGGLCVNAQAEVIDVFGQPIQKLYASGNASGVGSPGAMYGGGGGTIGPAMTFAYIAGKSISKRALG